MITRGRSIGVALQALLLASVFGCLNDVPTESGSPGSARLGLSARVTGLAPGRADPTVVVAVAYHASGGNAVTLHRESLPLTAGEHTSTADLQVDLGECLRDATREGADAGGCRLAVTLALEDAQGHPLVSQTRELGTVQEGATVRVPEPFVLVVPPAPPEPPGPPAAVGVSLAATTLQVGQTTGATAVVQDAQGRELGGASVEWLSSDAAVAAVSPATPGAPTATVTAVGAGAAEIRARVGDITSEPVRVTVVAIPPASVSVTLERASLTPGQATAATAVVRDALNRELTGLQVTWSSADGQIATVVPTALGASTATVTGVAVGSTQITATVDSGTGPLSSTPVTVEVIPAPQPTVTVAIDPTTFAVGDTARATAAVLDANGAPLPGAQVTWVVNPAGVVRVAPASGTTAAIVGVGPGEADIVANIVGGTVKSPPVRVRVTPRQPASIDIALAATELRVGETAQATAVVRDRRGQPVPDGSVTWTSNRPTIASLAPTGPRTATLTALGPGSAQVQASLGALRSNTVAVTVGLVASRLVFSQPPPASVEIGVPFEVSVTVEDAQGRPVTDYTSPVRLTLQGGGSGATLTRESTPENGVATFIELSVSQAGEGYTLLAISGALAGTSSAFTVTAGPPSATLSTVEASPSVIPQDTGTATITVTARDARGNPISGATVVLTATGSGNTFVQPAGGTDAGGVARGTLSSSVAETKTVSASIDGVVVTQTVTITVAPTPVSLMVHGAGSGSGSVSSEPGGIACSITDGRENTTGCSASYASGAQVTLVAAAAGQDAFEVWSGTGIDCENQATCTVSMTQAREVTATFTRVFTLTVKIGGDGGGRVTSPDGRIDCGTRVGEQQCSAQYPVGTPVTLEATPSGYDGFGGWDGVECPEGNQSNKCTLMISQDQTATATFFGRSG